MTGGRPGPRRVLPSYCLAIKRPVPGQQRVGRHNRGDIPQDAASECPGFRRESTALVVREPQTSGPELFPQDAVLFLEIVDDIALLLVHPTGERDQDEPQRMRQRGHGLQAIRAWVIGVSGMPDLNPTLHRKCLGNASFAASVGFLDRGGLTNKLVRLAPGIQVNVFICRPDPRFSLTPDVRFAVGDAHPRHTQSVRREDSRYKRPLLTLRPPR